MTDIHEIDSLKERLARIEKTVAEIKDSMGDGDDIWGDEPGPGPDELTPEEAELLKGGNEIEAVKSYHERTGLGLKESKDAVVRLGSGLGD